MEIIYYELPKVRIKFTQLYDELCCLKFSSLVFEDKLHPINQTIPDEVFDFNLLEIFCFQLALERGEKLSEAEERTERMKMEAEEYSKTAHQLMLKYKDKKWYQF